MDYLTDALTLNFWTDLTYNFYCSTWNFFYSWEFILAALFFLVLRWYRRNPEVIEEVVAGEPPEIHYRFQECPPWFPNGWQPVYASRDMPKGGVKAIYTFGEDLVIFRGQSGKVHCFDAYCPHLGANIGVGGVVYGELVKCPFHGWRFNTDGRCVFIPGLERREIPKASVKVWDVLEVNGFILIWYHSKGEKPQYKIEPVDDIEKKVYPFRCQYDAIVNAHIQDLNENGPDEKHFNMVHRYPQWLTWLIKVFGGLRGGQKLVNNTWTSKWTYHEAPEQYLATADMSFDYMAFGRPVFEAKYKVVNTGPAFGVTRIDILVLRWFTVTLYHVQSIIQLGPVHQQLVFHIHAKSRIVALLFKFGLIPQVERDKQIWDNKKFLARPYITKQDTPIKIFRRWYKQFYDEESDYSKNYKDPRMLEDEVIEGKSL